MRYWFSSQSEDCKRTDPGQYANIGSFRAKKLDLPDGRNLDGISVRSTSGLRMEDALNQEQELSEGGFEQQTQIARTEEDVLVEEQTCDRTAELNCYGHDSGDVT